ncbi:MAG: polysaccharide biosynthesis tyrosine autokinase [Chloroflexota bacterium]|nr:polysaccharide biosynthesis tyrosine autokinase [Chloroflexota bacterium]MBI5703893.1 polysaccharide biosynthesis tyrosine autokinase [Chloroflexota bacterium]
MELKEYFRIIKHWAWLLILGLGLGGTAGYVFSSYQTPVYQASTRIMVMRPPQESVSDYTYLSGQQLTQTYVQLVTTQPVLDAASAELGYTIEREQIIAQQIRDTQVIQLIVEDEDPARAAQIANVLVVKLIEQNDAFQAGRFNSAEESLREQIRQMETQISGLQTVINQISSQNLQDQIAQLEAQIKPLQEEVLKLEQEIAALPPYVTQNKILIAEKQARLDQIKPLLNVYQDIYSNLVVFGKPVNESSNDPQLMQLQSTLELYQQIYLSLLNSLETIRLARLQNTPNIVQIEPAAVPEEPIRPRVAVNTVLAAVIGLMLAVGIVFLVEYLDDTLKTADEVERLLGVPVLGFIAEMQYKGKGEEVYVTRQPRSPVSEAFRSLRTNLEYAAVHKPIHTLIVTSPEPYEGKTTVAVNLAAIFSQAKRSVILVDADLRHPNVHRYMGLPNVDGLSNLFREQSEIAKVFRSRVDLPKLTVVTTGPIPPNPAELLGSDRMTWILEELRSVAEMVIIDTPPSLVADAQVLAAKVDAVLLVIKPGKTSAEAARASMELYRRAGARVVGVVMNRIPRNRSYYYGGYKYYSPYNDNKGYFSSAAVELEETTSADSSNG